MTLLPPPPPADRRLGDRLDAGLGVSIVRPEIDFETYSEAGYGWDAERGVWCDLPGAPKGTRGLPLVGVEPYVRHPTFRLVWLAIDLKDGTGKHRWHPGCPPPMNLLDHVARGGEIEAWNASFERWVWELYCVPKLGWPAMREEQWYCAAAKARAFSLPGKLEKTGEVLGLDIQKDKEGGSLMRVFSFPRQPTKSDPRTVVLPVYTEADRVRRAHEIVVDAVTAEPGMSARKAVGVVARADAQATQEHIDTWRYGNYNVTDIAAEAEAAARIPDLQPEERKWWLTHERINRRGVHIDRVGVENCIAVVEQAFEKYNSELIALTGIDAASKVAQLQGWLQARGTRLESLDEEHVTEALESPLLPPDVRRVLQIRAAVGSASIKKLYAIRNRLSADDRLRDLYVYHGARTGRSTGEGPQPTNLPKAGPDMVRCGTWMPLPDGSTTFVVDSGCRQWYGQHRSGCPFCGVVKLAKPRIEEWNPDIAEQALRDVSKRSLEWMEFVYGDALATIAGCLRALFTAAPGHDLISTDYNSIEAIGLARLAGEQWRLKVFKTHGKIYEASAATMFGTPLDEILAWKKRTGQHHPLRQKGKVGELGFGYQGWVGAAHAFGMPGTDEEIKDDILRWRAASPAIEWLWGGQQCRKAEQPVLNASKPGYDGVIGEHHRFLANLDKRRRYEPYYFGVEGMAVLAMLEPGQWHGVARLDGTHSGIEFMSDAATRRLYCRLPSGRRLTYHNVILFQSDRGGYGMSYEGANTNPKNGPVGWIRMDTWGGRLVENIVQAVCRDILRAACEILEANGYPVVLHVYDEIVAEILERAGSIEEFERLVTDAVITLLEWAREWPIKAPGGYRAKRYRKG